jgi:hypothetical protein
MKKAFKWTASGLLTLAAAYGFLLAVPYRLFGYESAHGNITVYSDRPISPAIR